MMEALIADTHFWIVTAFVIALWVGIKFGRHSVLKALDDRTQRIKDELDEAEKLRIEAQEMLAKYQHKHRDAMKEADQIITNAQVQASKAKDKAMKDLQENIERLEQQAKNRIEMAQNEAEHLVRQEIVHKAVAQATAQIQKSLTTKSQEDFINHSIQNISKKVS